MTFHSRLCLNIDGYFYSNIFTQQFDVAVCPQVSADVHHGELLLRADLSGRQMSEGSRHPAPRQAEAQTGAQLRAGESTLVQILLRGVFFFFLNQTQQHQCDRIPCCPLPPCPAPQSTLLSSLSRHFRRGSPSSPASGILPSTQAKPPTPGSKMSHEGQEPFIQLVQAFVRIVQR